MASYRIISSAGVDMGTFEAETEQGALDAMARDAGYADDAEATKVSGRPFEGTVEEVKRAITDEQIEALRDEAGVADDPEMVVICNHALAGDQAALDECARVIAEARAQA